MAQKENTMVRCVIAFSLLSTAVSANAEVTTKIPQELTTPNYRVSEISGIGVEAGVERQDPSNVIKVGDTFSRAGTARSVPTRPSGASRSANLPPVRSSSTRGIR